MLIFAARRNAAVLLTMKYSLSVPAPINCFAFAGEQRKAIVRFVEVLRR
jgi:hypothetical protein